MVAGPQTIGSETKTKPLKILSLASPAWGQRISYSTLGRIIVTDTFAISIYVPLAQRFLRANRHDLSPEHRATNKSAGFRTNTKSITCTVVITSCERWAKKEAAYRRWYFSCLLTRFQASENIKNHLVFTHDRSARTAARWCPLSK